VFTDACVAGYMRLTGADLAEAIDLAAVRPRELFGLPVPRLKPGETAELVLFDLSPDGGLDVRAVAGGPG
jgi:dihydroorotase-like cyclic amidohydrolase